jgi:malate dehydrogenase (oxaloacetate-decarboxylating)(NADP+)
MDNKKNSQHFSDLEALQFHSKGKAGKIEIKPTKALATQRDLSLAYSPGVAAPVREIAENPDTVFDYTIKGNLVAVITNGLRYLVLVIWEHLLQNLLWKEKLFYLKDFQILTR